MQEKFSSLRSGNPYNKELRVRHKTKTSDHQSKRSLRSYVVNPKQAKAMRDMLYSSNVPSIGTIGKMTNDKAVKKILNKTSYLVIL